MFDHLSDLGQLFPFADEAFLSGATFSNTVGFLKFLEADPDEALSLSDELLVIELKEGVFIRTRSKAWSEALAKLAATPVRDYPSLKAYPVKKLDELVRNYRQPLNAFGDERLVRWKVGF